MTRKWRPWVKGPKGNNVQVEIEIDWTALARILGKAAVSSKRGKSTAMKGALKCKIYESKEAKRAKRRKAAGIVDKPIPLTELDDLILGRKTPEQVVKDTPRDILAKASADNQRLADAFNQSGVFKPFQVIPGRK